MERRKRINKEAKGKCQEEQGGTQTHDEQISF